jgi:hypothetical protein
MTNALAYFVADGKKPFITAAAAGLADRIQHPSKLHVADENRRSDGRFSTSSGGNSFLSSGGFESFDLIDCQSATLVPLIINILSFH